MNEQAIIDSYNTFVDNGYRKSLEEFKKLIASNPKALEDSYGTFQGVGYKKSLDEYKVLMGVTAQPAPQKKNEVLPSDTIQEVPLETPPTTELPADVTSSDLSSQAQPQAQPQAKAQPIVQPEVVPTNQEEPKEDGILSKIGKGIMDVQLGTYGVVAEAMKSLLSTSDDIVNAAKNSLKQGGFFDEDIPETNAPISDAIKQKLEEARAKSHSDMSPLDPRAIIGGIATIAGKVINSTLRKDQRDAIVNRLAIASNNIQGDIRKIESFQEDVLPKDNLAVDVTKGIVGMAPDLILAAMMENPAPLESKAALWTAKSTENAMPIIKNNAPKVAKFLEEAAVAPFTKIMATKGAISGMAAAKENENPYIKSVEGAVVGTVEGMYMHGLGVAAGKVAAPVSKTISRLGINSAIATAIATPLANAGVFTTAKALRVAATEQRLLTAKEAKEEAGMGIGFSLLHLGSQYKNHKELNHYYETTLTTNAANSLGRVLNETKESLDLAFNPNLTNADIKKLEQTRDELKKAALKEPDLNKKQVIGSEAIKIQNQLDAYNAINGIVDNKDDLIQSINDNKDFTPDQKKFYINKVSAIADSYDMSDFAVTKRDLNTKITEAQKELEDSGEAFTNLKSPSDRVTAKIDIDNKRKNLEDLNNQLTELITNKQKEDAIQKQAADESLLRAGQQRLGLQEVGEGDAESNLTPEQKQAITDDKDAFQEILDNPDNHDETDVQEAKDYFANPIAYYEGKIKFYEEEPNPTEEDNSALEHFKSMLEAHKALEVKPEVTDALKDVNSTEDALTEYVNQPDFGGTSSKNGYQNSEKQNKFFAIKDLVPRKIWAKGGYYPSKAIAEAYHEAKADGSNPELVKAVEDLLGKKPEGTTIQTGGEAPVSETIPATSDLPEHIQNDIDNRIEYHTKELQKAIEGDKDVSYIEYHREELEKIKSNPIGFAIENSQSWIDYYESELKKINENKVKKFFTKGAKDRVKYLEKRLRQTKQELNELSLLKATEAPETKTSTQPTGVEPVQGTSFTVGGGTATTTTGRRDVTMGGEGTETKTSGTDVIKTKKNEDNEHTVTLNGEEIGKMYYDPSQKTWQNANFNRQQEKGYSFKSIYGDILGESKQEAIDELIKRNKETKKEEPKKVEFTKDNILNKFLNKLNSLNPLQKNPIDNKSFVYGDKASLEFNRFDKKDRNEVSIESIMSLDKGKGAGKAVMKDITDAADAIGVKLTLDAKPFGREGLDKKQLIDFYKKNGFKVDFEDAFGGEFKTEQELIDYALENESEAVPMSRDPKAESKPGSITVGGEGVTTTTGGVTGTTEGKGTETKTSTSGIEKLTDYKEVMDEVDYLVPKSKGIVDRDLNKAKDRLKIAKAKGDKAKIEEAKIKLEKAKAEKEEYKTDVAKGIEKAMKVLTESDMYKNADNIQQDALVRDLNKRFGESQPSAPSPEKLAGTPKPEPVTMSGKDVLKEQIKSFARGAKAGVQGIRDSITQIVDYVKGTDINTKDLKKVMDVLKSKIETETDLNKAIEKVFKIVDSSDTDIVETRQSKIDKDKMKAEFKAAKEGKKSVVDKVKAIREYFESVKEFGNLTRKDLSKVIREISKAKDEKTLDKAVDKINNIIDKAKTDVLEISELKMIKDKLKGIKDAKKDLNEKRKLITAAIDFIQKSGNVSAKKVGKLLKDIGKVNLEDDTKIEKIIEYAEKVFEDAEYDNKLEKANALKKAISKLSRDKNKNAHLTALGKKFAELKTSMVDDIDAYIDMASKIKESLRGSKAGDENDPVKAAEMVNIEESMGYINDNMDAQYAKIEEDMISEVLNKLGIDATGMTVDEMRDLLKKETADDKTKQTIIKDGIKKMFDSYSAIIKHIFETGKDPFTGEDVDVNAEQKRLVSEFMGMDLDFLNTKKSLEAMDALSNFLQNGSTAKMEDVVRRYKGEENGRKLEAKGLKSKPLQFYWNEWVGRTLAEQIATLPTLTEMLFKSQSKSALFDNLSGLTEMRNKKTYVQTMSNVLSNKYVDQFYKTEANGKSFTDPTNITERGVIATVKRTMVGTPEQQQAEFVRKKKLIKDSITHLERGVEKEKKLAKIYKKVYDKLLDGSENVNDVLNKADNKNIEAVDFWIKEWDNIYDQLSDVSENVYNQILDRDINYTPDRYANLFNKGKAEELGLQQSLFNNNNGTVFQRKTGVLEQMERSNELPKNEDEKISRYLDLSFDKSNVNSMYDALMDIHTAGVVRQIESFFKSDSIDKIIPNGLDKSILYNDQNTGRVQDFIRAARNKELIDSSEAANATRKLNTLAGIGTATALASGWGLVKQTVPVAVNTLINTQGKLDLSFFMGAKSDFMNKAGYGISIRGMESQTQLKSINKLVDLASKSKGAKALDYINQANHFWLKQFLQKPDVFIARASWMSYYEKNLIKQGVDPKTIDYESHEVNKEAADYAQKMVDRQQNVSDHDLNGKLLSSSKPGRKLMTSVVMPFASFRLNQFMRATSDLATLTSMNKDNSITPQDKKAAAFSLVGYAVEMAVFKSMAYGISLLMGNVTNAIMGKYESEEDKNKREKNLFRSQVTGTITDIFSPLPPIDIAYAKGADKILSIAQDFDNISDDEKFKLMTTVKSTDMAKSWGTLGIAVTKFETLQDIAALSYTGKFTDEYGRTKYITNQDREALKLVGSLSFLANLGLLPADANTIARNALASAKRSSSTSQGGEEEEMDQEDRADKKERAKQNKINVLNEMLHDETDEGKRAAIKKEIMNVNKDEEDKEDIKDANDQEKAEKELLLEGYDSESDLKRYDRNLYEKNFGEYSDWYQKHKDENAIETELDKNLQEKEDVQRGYLKPKKNKDGSKKRKSSESSSSYLYKRGSR